MAKVSAIILAAGESKRMGADNKLLIPISGRPIIDHVVDAVLASDFHEIILVTSELTEDHFRHLKDSAVKVVNNLAYKSGMTSSIQAGVRVAEDTEGYMIILGDQPFVSHEDYNRLIQAFGKNQTEKKPLIVLPVFNDQKGNPVTFSVDFRDALLAHEQAEGCKAIVQDHAQSVITVPMPSNHILTDIDTPEDLKKLGDK